MVHALRVSSVWFWLMLTLYFAWKSLSFTPFPWYWMRMRIFIGPLIVWAWRCGIDCQGLLESLLLIMCTNLTSLALMVHLVMTENHFIWSWKVALLNVVADLETSPTCLLYWIGFDYRVHVRGYVESSNN